MQAYLFQGELLFSATFVPVNQRSTQFQDPGLDRADNAWFIMIGLIK